MDPRGYFRRRKRRRRKKRKWERIVDGGVYPVVVEVREEWCTISRNIVFICEIKNNEH